MSERCKRTSERRSEWPSTLRVDFISFDPTVRCIPMSHVLFVLYQSDWVFTVVMLRSVSRVFVVCGVAIAPSTAPTFVPLVLDRIRLV